MRIPDPVLAVFVLGLLGAGCSTPSDDVPLDTTTSSTSSNTSTVAERTSTTATTVSTASAAPTTVRGLPGESYEGSGPRTGDFVAVVGVAHDDVLNVREGPGTSFDIVSTLDPTTVDIPVTGKAWLLANSLWYEIAIDSGTGWVNSSFIGLLGATDDATVLVHDMLGNPLAADDFHYLGATIADAFLGAEGSSWIALVEVSQGGSSSAIPSVMFDTIGLSDDSLKGYRFVIHATHETTDGPYELHSVERTFICRRGLTPENLCL
jgi:hypothetical protein